MVCINKKCRYVHLHALVIVVILIFKVHWKTSIRAAWLKPRDSTKNLKHRFEVFKVCLFLSLIRNDEILALYLDKLYATHKK